MSDTPQMDVIIGGKPTMNYVVACLTLFNAGSKRVSIKARGQRISHAIDTVELLRRAFVKDLNIQSIEIGSQEFIRGDGVNSRVSTIEITISKPNEA
jgi:DNA-binding protein